jgi:hypothetical protein
MGELLFPINDIRAMRRERSSVFYPLITTLVSLTVYLLTLIPEPWGDTAELSLQAYRLGVTHPPGYPVHTFLGRLFIFAFSEPIVATTVMSAICTSLAVGLLTLMVLEMTGDRFASLIAAFIFAFSSIIWEMAVITEVYNVNIFFFALSLYLILSWYRKPSKKLLIASALAFGISLGSYLANLLLLPAFIFLILQKPKNRMSSLITFLVFVGLLGCLMLGWSVFRSQATPPLGTLYVPNSPKNAILYFTGRQYGTISVQSIGFYLKRPIEHAYRFSLNILGVGALLGLVGFLSQWRTQRPQAITLFIIAAVNLGYFTTYKIWDYFTMVTPSYLVFSIWIAFGVHFLSRLDRPRITWILRVCLVTLIVAVFVVRLPSRLARAHSSPNTEFCLASFDIFPRDAVVVTGFGALTALLYFQEVHNLRTDVTLIEHKWKPRHYDFGTIEGCLDYIDIAIDTRPVIIDHIDDGIKDKYEVTPINEDWSQLESRVKSRVDFQTIIE